MCEQNVSFENTLCANNINAFWNKTKVLNDISLCVKQGEFICLSGANGCGKSTLLTVLSGIDVNGLTVQAAQSSVGKNNISSANTASVGKTASVSNTILLNNKPLSSYKRKEAAKHIAYLTQSESSAWNYTVQDIILSGRYCHTNRTGIYSQSDYAVVKEVISLLKLDSLKDRSVYSLSGGEYQKVRIARCLAQEPDFLLLDEPVANLDFSYQNELLSLLKNIAANGYSFSNDSQKKYPGILISIHDINTASRFADKLLLFSKINPQSNSQLLLSGSPHELLTKENLRLVYNSDFGIYTHPQFNCPQVFC